MMIIIVYNYGFVCIIYYLLGMLMLPVNQTLIYPRRKHFSMTSNFFCTKKSRIKKS